MASLERAILAEAKEVIGNKKLRMKDIMEWSTGKFKAEEGEKLYHLPGIGVDIAVKEWKMKNIIAIEFDWTIWGVGMALDNCQWEICIIIGPLQITIGWDL